MRPDTQRTIHLGVNYLVSPPPIAEVGSYLRFQQLLAEEQIDFAQVNRTDGQVVFVRRPPSQLQVQIGPAGPGAPVGNLLIVAGADPASPAVTSGVSVHNFKEDANTIATTFREVWAGTQQIVAADAAVRLLYDAGGDHAFRYLWEVWLGQQEETLLPFERPVVGGGLRLVFGPPGDPAIGLTDVKLESFLADPSKLWVEVVMRWPQARPAVEMSPAELVDALEEFVGGRVLPFLSRRHEA